MGRILAVQIGAKVNSGNLRIALQRETVNISMSTQSQIICKHWDTYSYKYCNYYNWFNKSISSRNKYIVYKMCTWVNSNFVIIYDSSYDIFVWVLQIKTVILFVIKYKWEHTCSIRSSHFKAYNFLHDI